MLVLIAAALLASAPPWRPPTSQAPSALDTYLAKETAWEKANLDTSGWSLVTLGTEILIFLGPTSRSRTGNPLVAVRGEHYPFAQTNPIGTGESFLSRDEIDCAKALERTISSTVYSDAGLQGAIASASDDPSDWKAIKDGTFMAQAEKALCPGASR